MSDAKDDKTNDQNREGRAPLTLKPRVGGNVSTGTVKQSFSHGRSKTVVVETKRRIGTPPPATNAPARPGHETNLARPNPQASAPRPATALGYGRAATAARSALRSRRASISCGAR